MNIIFEGEEEFGIIGDAPVKERGEVPFEGLVSQLRTSELDDQQREKLRAVIWEYKRLFVRKFQPARVGSHRVELIPNVVRKKPHCYAIPITFRREV